MTAHAPIGGIGAVRPPRLSYDAVMPPGQGGQAPCEGQRRHLRGAAQCRHADAVSQRPALDHTRTLQLWCQADAHAAAQGQHVRGDDPTCLRRIADARMLLARRGPREAVLG